MLASIPKKRDYIAERGLDEYLYLVNPDDLRIHRFEAAGKKLWELIDGKSTGEDLAHAYCRATDKPFSDRLKTAVDSFLENLRALDLTYTDDEPGLRNQRVCKKTGAGKELSEPMESRSLGADGVIINDMWERAARKRIILKTDLELTYACNHACLHCYNPSERRKTLTTQEFLNLIDDLAGQGLLFLGLTGGEVFTRPDAIKLARRAREHKMSIRFLTNGSMIDEELADQIAEIHPESVEISILGVRPETHDHFAQAPGSFARILEVLQMLAEREINVFARYVFTKYNVTEAPELPKLCANLGVKHLFPAPHLFPTVDRDMGPTDHRVTDDQLKWLRQIGILDPHGHAKCFAGVSRCSISPWGEIHPCEFLPHVVGNIKEQRPVREIWTSSEERVIWEDPRVHEPPSCQGCSNQSICYRCPAMSFLEDGTLTGSSSHACRVSNTFQEAAREMREPGWTPPAYDDSWTKDFSFLQSMPQAGAAAQGCATPSAENLVQLRVIKK